tara:strand:- start:1329 stop:1610 length:282 start_codon:yes stop_codon:yes gene_type:complete
MESKKLLTTTRMKEIVDDFKKKCGLVKIKESPYTYDDYLKEGHSNEEEWIDNDSYDMKFNLIDNYLLEWGYHNLEEEGNVPSRVELIMNYLKK